MIKELLELRAIIKGNVQGVGFRATTKLYAEQLKLVGFVRNLPDGNVEMCAQGDKQTLEKLVKKLRLEFEGYIHSFDANYSEATQHYPHFTILR